MVKNIIIVLILIPLAIIFFAPKRELYYLLEQKLQEKNIIISSEELETTLLGINVSHPTFFASGVPVAKAAGFSIWSLMYSTNFNAEEVKVAEGFPQEITVDELGISNTIIAPFDLSISGASSLGNLDGEVNLNDKTIHLAIDQKEVPKYYSNYFKKSEQGAYYESNF